MAGRSISTGRVSRKAAPVRYAVAGLGDIAQSAILLAFARARRTSRLAALVSDDPEPFERARRPRPVEAIRRPPVPRAPELVHAQAPAAE